MEMEGDEIASKFHLQMLSIWLGIFLEQGFTFELCCISTGALKHLPELHSSKCPDTFDSCVDCLLHMDLSFNFFHLSHCNAMHYWKCPDILKTATQVDARAKDAPVEIRQHCRLNVCSYFGWFDKYWQIWDEQACLVEMSVKTATWQLTWSN